MKKVLVTGAATGIGKATAKLFLNNGYDVFGSYHKTPLDYDGVTAVKCDLSNLDDIEKMFKAAGDIDVLVNNAGVSLIKQINDTTQQEYDAVNDINAKACFFASKLAVKSMLKRHRGAIVNISSVWGQLGASCEVAYSMSKAAVIGLTKALAQELAPSQITVNCVCPGIIDTRMNSAFNFDDLADQVPLGRLGTAEEVAAAVLFFAQNRYISGQILGVNGAMT